MKKSLLAVLLFAAQLFLLFRGVDYLGVFVTPFPILIVSLGISWLYMSPEKVPAHTEQANNGNWRWAAIAATFIGLAGCAYLFRHALWNAPQPALQSDVIPQLEALYDRFAKGEQPYYPLPLANYAPYPVYMPLHWLPLAIARLLHFDTRWLGFGMLAAACLLYAFKQPGKPASMISALLPVVVFACFIQYGDMDVLVTLETIVAAYYLLLATGLSSGKFGIVIAGIVCCMLSRYTLVFWLPLAAYVFWQSLGQRKALLAIGIVTGCILLLYVLPFLMRQPSILKEGVAYHNQAAVAEWQGYGNPPVSYSHMTGVSFDAGMKKILPGDAAHKVGLVRVLQAGIMLLLVVAGIMVYRRRKAISNPYIFALGTLYLCLLLFYEVGALTYRYYYISFFMLSAVMCGQVIDNSLAKVKSTSL